MDCDAIPDVLRPTIIESQFAHEISGDDGAVYFEPIRTFAF